MSFDQDPNEQASISAADFAQMCDEMKMLQTQANALHQVAGALGFNAGDDVTRAPWAVAGLVKQRDDLLYMKAKNEFNCSIGNAIQHACAELPEGYLISVELENGAGYVANIYLPDTDATIDSFGGENLADEIYNAVNIAIAESDKANSHVGQDTNGGAA